MMRTRYCGLFREEDVGREACAAGWVENRRDMGGVEDAYEQVMGRLRKHEG